MYALYKIISEKEFYITLLSYVFCKHLNLCNEFFIL